MTPSKVMRHPSARKKFQRLLKSYPHQPPRRIRQAHPRSSNELALLWPIKSFILISWLRSKQTAPRLGLRLIRIIQQAEHGEITFENGTGFSNFAKENIRYECNKRRTEGVILSYEPSLGYTGLDSLTVDVIFASGNSGKRHYTIEVK
jgi:hypothetical protein